MPLQVEGPRSRPDSASCADVQKIADQVLLARYAPPSVLVNEKLDILEFIGQTGRFLDPTPGEATLNVLKLVKGGLQVEMRLAFQKTKRAGTVRKEGVLVELDGALKPVNFEILTCKGRAGAGPLLRRRFRRARCSKSFSVHKECLPSGRQKSSQNQNF